MASTLHAMLVFSDERMLAHDAGAGHPERPARLRAVLDALAELPSDLVKFATPRPVTKEQLALVHDARYVQWIESMRGTSAPLDADTALSPGSVEAALLSAGAAIDAVEAVMRGDDRTAWAMARPPGHHAEADRAMGFCVFNNIAVAAAHVIDAGLCQRVLIVDWDVHHGNGTQHIFESRRDVLVFNTHQWPMYPGSGAIDEVGRGEGKGFTINVPLPAGSGDADYQAVFREVLVPAADEFRPELVMISAGFDAHQNDPLGGMRVTAAGFASLAAITRELARRHAAGRIVLCLEGGYDLEALADSVVACARVLGEIIAPPGIVNSQGINGAARRVIDAVRAVQKPYWRSLQ